MYPNSPSPTPSSATPRSRLAVSASCDGFDFSSIRKPRRTWDFVNEPEDMSARTLLRDMPDVSEDDHEGAMSPPPALPKRTPTPAALNANTLQPKRSAEPNIPDSMHKRDTSKNSPAIKSMRRSTSGLPLKASRVSSSPVMPSPANLSTPPTPQHRPPSSTSKSMKHALTASELTGVARRLHHLAGEGRTAVSSGYAQLPEGLRGGALQMEQMRAAAADSAVRAIRNFLAADKVLKALDGLKAAATAASGGQAGAVMDSFLAQHSALQAAAAELAAVNPIRHPGPPASATSSSSLEAAEVELRQGASNAESKPEPKPEDINMMADGTPQPPPSPPSTPRQSPHRASPLPPRSATSSGARTLRRTLSAHPLPQSTPSTDHSDEDGSSDTPQRAHTQEAPPSAVSANVLHAVEDWFLQLLEHDICPGKGVRTRQDCVVLLGALTRAQDWLDKQLGPSANKRTGASSGGSSGGESGGSGGGGSGDGNGLEDVESVGKKLSSEEEKLSSMKMKLQDALMRWAVQRHKLPVT